MTPQFIVNIQHIISDEKCYEIVRKLVVYQIDLTGLIGGVLTAKKHQDHALAFPRTVIDEDQHFARFYAVRSIYGTTEH